MTETYCETYCISCAKSGYEDVMYGIILLKKGTTDDFWIIRQRFYKVNTKGQSCSVYLIEKIDDNLLNRYYIRFDNLDDKFIGKLAFILSKDLREEFQFCNEFGYDNLGFIKNHLINKGIVTDDDEFAKTYINSRLKKRSFKDNRF